jgi:hypothetical protein
LSLKKPDAAADDAGAVAEELTTTFADELAGDFAEEELFAVFAEDEDGGTVAELATTSEEDCGGTAAEDFGAVAEELAILAEELFAVFTEELLATFAEEDAGTATDELAGDFAEEELATFAEEEVADEAGFAAEEDKYLPGACTEEELVRTM